MCGYPLAKSLRVSSPHLWHCRRRRIARDPPLWMFLPQCPVFRGKGTRPRYDRFAGMGRSHVIRAWLLGASASFMLNEIENHLQVHESLVALRRIETLNLKLHGPAVSTLSNEGRNSLRHEFVQRQNELPAALMQLLRGRIRLGQQLVAPMRNGNCAACYMAVPRADRLSVLADHEAIVCQFCGILLFADDNERAAARERKEVRPC